jgi:hypothetical protein
MARKFRIILHNGRADTLAGWAAKIGISGEALAQRLLHGWSEAEAVTTKRYGRTPERLRRAEKPATLATPINPQLDELTSNHLKQRRAVNRTLRQFCRDLDAIMCRGVSPEFLKSRFDRSIPVARGLPEIGNS